MTGGYILHPGTAIFTVWGRQEEQLIIKFYFSILDVNYSLLTCLIKNPR